MSRNKVLLGSLVAVIAIVIIAVLIFKPSNDNDVADGSGIVANNVGEETVDQHAAEIDDVEDDAEGNHVEDDAEPVVEPVAVQPVVRSVQEDIPSLAEVYVDYFPIGAAVELYQLEDLTADLLKKHVNMLVAENVMKPDAMQPTEGNFRWDQADKIVNFAKENDMEVRFHTLIWHSQVPGWFFIDEDGKRMVDETDESKREANKELLLERLESHVKTIVSRYKDDIKSWDVVNEVVEPNDPDGMRNSEWYQITGTEFIERAFHAAREAGGPDARLYINDYSTDDPRKRDRMYELVKELLDKGVPIDGVGHQTHISVAYPPAHQIITSMEKFAELGLDNIITELDMSLYVWDDRSDYGADIPAHVLNRQATQYQILFKQLRENQHLVSEVVFWGISDAHTWLHTFPVNSRTDAPLPFDQNFHAKPAFWAIIDEPQP